LGETFNEPDSPPPPANQPAEKVPPRSYKKGTGRVVHFDEDKNTCHSSNFSLEELKEIWYSQEECERFQESTTFLGEQFARSNSAYGAILRRVYSKACTSSNDDDDDDENDDEHLQQQQQQQGNEDHVLVSLKNIIKKSTGKLGLERKITRSLRQHVAAKKIVMNNVVVRGNGIASGCCCNNNNNNMVATAEQIRIACEGRSRSSRLFALYWQKHWLPQSRRIYKHIDSGGLHSTTSYLMKKTCLDRFSHDILLRRPTRGGVRAVVCIHRLGGIA
jgi:hypothetical protein